MCYTEIDIFRWLIPKIVPMESERIIDRWMCAWHSSVWRAEPASFLSATPGHCCWWTDSGRPLHKQKDKRKNWQNCSITIERIEVSTHGWPNFHWQHSRRPSKFLSHWNPSSHRPLAGMCSRCRAVVAKLWSKLWHERPLVNERGKENGSQFEFVFVHKWYVRELYVYMGFWARRYSPYSPQ